MNEVSPILREVIKNLPKMKSSNNNIKETYSNMNKSLRLDSPFIIIISSVINSRSYLKSIVSRLAAGRIIRELFCFKEIARSHWTEKASRRTTSGWAAGKL